MAQQIVLPKLGLTMQEGVIGEWIAASGSRIALGDTLLRLETDKVDVDVEAEAEGILATVADAGAVLPVGALIGWLLAEGEGVPGSAETVAPAGGGAQASPEIEDATATSASAVPQRVDGDRIKSSPNARRIAAEFSVDIAAITGTGPDGRIVSEDVEDYLTSQPSSESRNGAGSTVNGHSLSGDAAGAPSAIGAAAELVGPLVRRRAEELGVDLATVTGTGVGGRIIRADVDRAAAQGNTADTSGLGVADSARTPIGPGVGDVIPLTGMRGAIARNMVESLHTMAQLTHGYEADVTDLVALRATLKAELAESGRTAPSLNDFVVKAAALALREHPLVNATVRDDGIHLLSRIDVGVAVAVPGGLVVPVVRGTDELAVTQIGEQTRSLAARARTGKLALADMEGATFSVSTLGAYGVDFFTPVINPGNVAILGVGRVKDGIRWDAETPIRTQVLTLSLTFDHRAVDGAPAAEYLKTVTALLGRPLALLAG